MSDYLDKDFALVHHSILQELAKARKAKLVPINLRLSPAAHDIIRAANRRDGSYISNGDQNEPPTFMGLHIITEMTKADYGDYSQIRVCVEAQEDTSHGRYSYFEAVMVDPKLTADLNDAVLQGRKEREGKEPGMAEMRRRTDG
jgi:hypothetical protein